MSTRGLLPTFTHISGNVRDYLCAQVAQREGTLEALPCLAVGNGSLMLGGVLE